MSRTATSMPLANALVECNACGQEMSSVAAACPRCKRPVVRSSADDSAPAVKEEGPAKGENYVLINDQENGPFTDDDLRSMLKSGAIIAETLTARPNDQQWVPVVDYLIGSERSLKARGIPGLPPTPSRTRRNHPGIGKVALAAGGAVLIVALLLVTSISRVRARDNPARQLDEAVKLYSNGVFHAKVPYSVEVKQPDSPQLPCTATIKYSQTIDTNASNAMQVNYSVWLAYRDGRWNVSQLQYQTQLQLQDKAAEWRVADFTAPLREKDDWEKTIDKLYERRSLGKLLTSLFK